MNRPRLQNENCAILRRTSTNSQGEGHLSQGRTVEQTIKFYNMDVVKEIDLKGVSGSMPGNRTDINEIITFHKRANSFRYLLLPSADRFTRAGSLHGLALLWDLLVEGIVVYFVKEDLFSDDERDRSYLGFLFDAARQSVVTNGTASTEGKTYSVLDGRSPYTCKPPFGFDRLYSVDGKPRHVIRNKRDGTQEMWTPERIQSDRKLIQRFAANPLHGTPNHYRKQKNETVALIEGDPKHLKLVVMIMEMIWVRKISDRAAAKELNELMRVHPDMEPPEGQRWWNGTVTEMARRPIYIGLGTRLRKKGGVYVNATKTGKVIPSGVEMKELATRKHVKACLRPRSEWLEVQHPEFEKLLPARVRDAAFKGINDYLDSIAGGIKPTPKNPGWNGARRRLLSGLLRSKQGDERMVGGGGKKPHNYYVTVSCKSAPDCDPIKNLVVPGKVLDDAMVEVVADVMLQRDDLASAMESAIKQAVSGRKQTGIADEDRAKQLRSLRAQQVRLNRQLTGVEEDDEELCGELARLEAKIRDVIGRPSFQKRKVVQNPANTVKHFLKEFKELNCAVKEMDIPSLRPIVHALVTRMVVDLTTRVVDVDLALPDWMPDALFGHSKGTLLSLFDLKTEQNNNAEFRQKLGFYRLHYIASPKPARYVWERLKAKKPRKAA